MAHINTHIQLGNKYYEQDSWSTKNESDKKDTQQSLDLIHIFLFCFFQKYVCHKNISMTCYTKYIVKYTIKSLHRTLYIKNTDY